LSADDLSLPNQPSDEDPAITPRQTRRAVSRRGGGPAERLVELPESAPTTIATTAPTPDDPDHPPSVCSELSCFLCNIVVMYNSAKDALDLIHVVTSDTKLRRFVRQEAKRLVPLAASQPEWERIDEDIPLAALGGMEWRP